MSAAPAPATSRTARITPWLVYLTVQAGLFSLGLGWIARSNTDLPAPAELTREAQTHLLPALNSTAAGPAIITEPAPLSRLWAATWVGLTGQWDARVLALANLALALLALGTLLALARAHLAPRRWLWLAAAGLLFPILAAAWPRAAGAAAQAHAGWWLTLLQLTLTAPTRRRTSRIVGWWLGLVNLAVSPLGLAAALATVVRDALALRRDPATPRATHLSSLAANGALVLLGLGLAFARTGHGAPATDQGLLLNLAWPLGSAPAALVVWAPALFALSVWVTGRGANTATHPWLGSLALAALGGASILTALGEVPSPEWLLFALLINTACLAALPSADRAGRTRNFCLAAAWAIVVANALVHRPAPVQAGPAVDSPLTRSLCALAGGRGPAALPPETSLDTATQQELGTLLSLPALRHVWPASIRPPLALSGAAGALPDTTPAGLPSPDGLPVHSTWSAAQPGAREGEFASAPLTTAASLVQVRVAGTLRPPETAVVLVTADGREIAPYETTYASETRWKRVNFPVPAGSFRLVVRDRSATLWLACTAPQEISRTSWIIAKFVRSWVWWAGAGLILTLAAGVALIRDSWRQAVTADFDWRVVPWLGLFAYALFFARHLDNTAGPNDSGGYLNLAKTFAHGRTVEAIRSLPIAAPEAKNLELYLPSTAHLTADHVMSPEYPPGYPLLIAGVAQLLPFEHAVSVVIWLHLVLGVLATWHAGRVFGLSAGWAWLGAGIVGLSSVYLFQGLQPQSDGPALVWVTAAVSFAWASRERPGWAWLAGLATAVAVLIRPADALCFVPVLACIWDRPRQLLRLILAGAPAGLWLMWFNHRMYGSAFTTGYGDVSTWFGWGFLKPTLISYASWLPVMFTPVWLAALAAPWTRGFAPRARTVLSLWAGAFLVFYSVYWCTYDNWYNMRFVLPAAPALLVLGLGVCQFKLRGTRWELFAATMERRGSWASAVLTVVLLGIAVADTTRQAVLYWVQASRSHRVAVDWLRARAPANSVVLARHASNAVWHYTDFVLLRPDNPATHSLAFLQAIADSGRPLYAINQHWEQRDFTWGHGKGTGRPDLPGDWERLGSFWEDEYVVWRWRPPGPAPARR